MKTIRSKNNVKLVRDDNNKYYVMIPHPDGGHSKAPYETHGTLANKRFEAEAGIN